MRDVRSSAKPEYTAIDGGDVARGEACVHGKALESLTSGRSRSTKNDRRPVRRRLDADRCQARNLRQPARWNAEMMTTPPTSPGARTAPRSSEPTNNRASKSGVRRRPTIFTGRASAASSPSGERIHDVNARPSAVVAAASTQVAGDDADEEDDDGMPDGRSSPAASAAPASDRPARAAARASWRRARDAEPR